MTSRTRATEEAAILVDTDYYAVTCRELLCKQRKHLVQQFVNVCSLRSSPRIPTTPTQGIRNQARKASAGINHDGSELENLHGQ